MSSYHVKVSGLAPESTEKSLTDFFTFCGNIKSLEFKQDEKTAIICFENPSAARTAVMLNGGNLDGASLTVTSDVVHLDDDTSADADGINQSDKPRAGIVAEYLAKGYILSDQILQRAIELDNKQGISTRFLSYFHSLDSTLGNRALGPDQTISSKVQQTVTSATEQAKAVDAQRGLSKTAGEYYFKALSSPFGQKVKQFYTTTSKQVVDIHEEARRISESKKAATPLSAAELSTAAPPKET